MFLIQIPFFILALYIFNKHRQNRDSSYKNHNIVSKLNEKIIKTSSIDGNKALYNSTYYPRRFSGLRNLGNTCYMNCILQSLYASDQYRNKIISTEFKENTIGQELKSLFVDLHKEVDSISIRSLVKLLDINVKIQEDAEEFLLNLINKVDDSMQKAITMEKEMIHNTTSDTNDTKIKNPSDTMKFQIEQVIKCIHVDKTKYKQLRNIDLSIDLHNGGKSVTSSITTTKQNSENSKKTVGTLVQAMNRYFETELLTGENQYRTAEFGLQDAKKSLLLKSLPDLLIIHLKRFEFDGNTFEMRKIGDSIDIPLAFVLSTSPNKTTISDYKLYTENKNIADDSSFFNMTNTIYNLNSAVIHQGTIDSGHYYSLCRRMPATILDESTVNTIVLNRTISDVKNNIIDYHQISLNPNKWMKINDHIVSDIHENEVLKEIIGTSDNQICHSNSYSTNAYILFYEKQR